MQRHKKSENWCLRSLKSRLVHATWHCAQCYHIPQFYCKCGDHATIDGVDRSVACCRIFNNINQQLYPELFGLAYLPNPQTTPTEPPDEKILHTNRYGVYSQLPCYTWQPVSSWPCHATSQLECSSARHCHRRQFRVCSKCSGTSANQQCCYLPNVSNQGERTKATGEQTRSKRSHIRVTLNATFPWPLWNQTTWKDYQVVQRTRDQQLAPLLDSNTTNRIDQHI